MQLFIRNLVSSTLVCDAEPCTTVGEVKDWLERREGVPSTSQCLVYAGRQLQDEQQLCCYGITADSTLHMVLRLRGGKGGFGAILRSQGRDGKTTTNFDACRDLQGRRLKQQTTEKKLAEWKGDAKERELEKIALKHIKDMTRQAKREEEEQVDVEAVVQAQKDTLAKVQDAVQSALAAAGPSAPAPALANGKRAPPEPAAKAQLAPAAKKPKMLAALESFGDDDEGSTSSDEDAA